MDNITIRTATFKDAERFSDVVRGTCRIAMAKAEDSDEILNLYKTHLGGPADWNEYYPNEETIAFDLSRDSLFVMKNEEDEIIAAISIDSDEEVDTLTCWNKSLTPAGEVSRVCVRKDMQNRGIAGMMMQYVFEILKERGMKMVHILVRTGHAAALRSYSQLGFLQVGECELFDKQFVCMEKAL